MDDTRNEAARHVDHVVLCIKPATLQRVVFSRYPTRTEAELIAARLRSVGCPCDVERARPGDAAGMQRPSR